ncbi:MAG: glutamine--tRNA ligase, partial [Desulfobulbales bacterium]
LYDPETKGGNAPDGRKVKATLHWVSANHALEAEVRLYSHLFTRENPADAEEGKDFTAYINEESLEVLPNCQVEPSLKNAEPESIYQFERLGYFCADRKDCKKDKPVFNRSVTLRDSWTKIKKKA